VQSVNEFRQRRGPPECDTFCIVSYKKEDTTIEVNDVTVLSVFFRPHHLRRVQRCGGLWPVVTTVAWFLCLLVTTMSCATMSEPVEMLLGAWTRVAQGTMYMVTQG